MCVLCTKPHYAYGGCGHSHYGGGGGGYKLLSQLEWHTHTAQSCRVTHPEEEEKVPMMAVNAHHLHLAEVTAEHFIAVWDHFDRHGESCRLLLNLHRKQLEH